MNIYLKDKYTKEVLPAMDIINTLFTQEIIGQYKCQMGFLGQLVLKQDVCNKLINNAINYSMLESPYTSDDDNMDNGDSKSKF